MNELEEVCFGILEGARKFDQLDVVERAAGSKMRVRLVREAFNQYRDDFEKRRAIDIYLLCFSKHDPSNNDGVLSIMARLCRTREWSCNRLQHASVYRCFIHNFTPVLY